MIKDTRVRLFEMMNRVGGMPLSESKLPPGFSEADFTDLEDYFEQPSVSEETEVDTSVDVEKNPNLKGIQFPDDRTLKDIVAARERGEYKGQAPYLHPKTIEKLRIVNKDTGQEISDEEFRRLTTVKPKSLLGTNTKMGKTGVLKTSLPAYEGLYWDENKRKIRVVSTCRNAGTCKRYCFQQKGGPVQYEMASLDKTRALNFLLNHWDEYKQKIYDEIKAAKSINDSKGLKTVIRWHDSGDFLSEQYLDLVMEIARNTPDVLHYAYTKMVQFAKTASEGGKVPDNFIFRFSVDPESPDNALIDKLKDKHAEVVPKQIWKDYVSVVSEVVMGKKGMPMMAKDKKTGNMVQKKQNKYYYHPNNENDPTKGLLGLKKAIADFYTIPIETIKAFYEMPETEEGRNKWNVIVTPSDADSAAHRQDVLGVYLLIH
jgi:hypothetical protein